METSLPLIWAFLIAAAVFLYVVLDGFDLGIGILFPAAIGYAILRQRLFDIDLVVKKTVTYSLIAIALTTLSLGWQYASLLLVPGPVLGALAMHRLRTGPELTARVPAESVP